MRERYLPTDIPVEVAKVQKNFRSLEKNRLVFIEGDSLQKTERQFFIILSGLIGLSSFAGEKRSIDFVAKKGDIFGYEDFGTSRRSRTAEALVDSTIALIDINQVENPEEKFFLQGYLVKKMEERINFLTERRLFRKNGYALVRVADALLRLSDNNIVSVNQQTVADYAGLTRQTVVDELSPLRSRDVVFEEGRTIHVINPEFLLETVRKAIKNVGKEGLEPSRS